MEKTICALSTPPGVGGMAVIRVSGKHAIEIAEKVFYGTNSLKEANTHTIHYGKLIHKDILIDKVTCAVFRSPNSYTGEDIVEISCHGGMLIVDGIIEALLKNGAFHAEPGQFTKRAFLNGKIDLTQAEAVADMIHSVSIPGAQTSARQLEGSFTKMLNDFNEKLMDIAGLLELELDFADEDLEFVPRAEIRKKLIETEEYCLELVSAYKSSEILRSGYFVGLAGFPNSGKSTLFNALLKRQRAIVSDVPGTTRDYIEEIIHINGIAVRLIDTAGIRETSDTVEIAGITMMESVLKQSNLIFVINDLSIEVTNSDKLFDTLKEKYPDSKVILLQNKYDLVDIVEKDRRKEDMYISAKRELGIDNIKILLENEARSSTQRTKDILINQRHALLLKRAAEEIRAAIKAIDENRENELVTIDIRNAAATLGELTGEKWSEDVLNHIFSRFCIGK